MNSRITEAEASGALEDEPPGSHKQKLRRSITYRVQELAGEYDINRNLVTGVVGDYPLLSPMEGRETSGHAMILSSILKTPYQRRASRRSI